MALTGVAYKMPRFLLELKAKMLSKMIVCVSSFPKSPFFLTEKTGVWKMCMTDLVSPCLEDVNSKGDQ